MTNKISQVDGTIILRLVFRVMFNTEPPNQYNSPCSVAKFRRFNWKITNLEAMRNLMSPAHVATKIPQIRAPNAENHLLRLRIQSLANIQCCNGNRCTPLLYQHGHLWSRRLSRGGCLSCKLLERAAWQHLTISVKASSAPFCSSSKPALWFHDMQPLGPFHLGESRLQHGSAIRQESGEAALSTSRV